MKVSNNITTERAEELKIIINATIKRIGECQVQMINYKQELEKQYAELQKAQKELWGF